MKTPVSLLSVSLISLALSGCGGPNNLTFPDRSPASRVAADMADLVGVWSVRVQWSIGDEAYHAILIRPDGTGEIIYPFIRSDMGRFWVTGANFQLLPDARDGWRIRFTTNTVILAQNIHSDKMANRYKQGTEYPLIATKTGLVVDGGGESVFVFKRESAAVPQSIAEYALQKNLEIKNRLGIPDTATRTDNSGALFAAMSGYQLGTGLGAMKQGNRVAASLAFDSAQRNATAALTGQKFDATAAATDALRTGIAARKGFDPFATPAGQAATKAAETVNAAAGAGDAKSGMVTLGPTEIASYTDGYAYNIQTVAANPGGRSVAEYLIQYGIPVDQARSFMATGQALSADRSVYGPGNPQQTNSWERFPVKAGDTIKMGYEWQKGIMPPPRFPNRYYLSPIR